MHIWCLETKLYSAMPLMGTGSRLEGNSEGVEAEQTHDEKKKAARRPTSHLRNTDADGASATSDVVPTSDQFDLHCFPRCLFN